MMIVNRGHCFRIRSFSVLVLIATASFQIPIETFDMRIELLIIVHTTFIFVMEVLNAAPRLTTSEKTIPAEKNEDSVIHYRFLITVRKDRSDFFHPL